MHKIRKAYERVALWLINQLATTIVRSADIGIVELLDLKPFMHVIRGDNGVRHIGIYCDPVWKTLNGFPNSGAPYEMKVRFEPESDKPEIEAKPKTTRRRKSVKR
jgi:hypothetical protein